MHWVKKGVIYNTDGRFDWSLTHAQVPKSNLINPETLRIYFGTRDALQRTRTSYIDVNPENPKEILHICDYPILELGRAGTFDESGVMPSSIIDHQGKKFLFYTGWNTDKSVPYRLSIGLAISYDKGETFEKASEGPILDRSTSEPISLCMPFVLIKDNKWMMWYSSFSRWESINGKLEPFYNIKFAESNNGIDWKLINKTCLDFDDSSDALVNPYVWVEDDIFKMFYSYRKNIDYRTNSINSYRIGYAVSNDGIEWKKKMNEPIIEPSRNEWDSEMVAYPNIFSNTRRKFLFYNGNGFGKTGFGYAELIKRKQN